MNADFRRSALIRGNPRLLLCNTVNCSHAPDERFAVDRDHLASGKDFLKRFDHGSVVGVTEHGRQYDLVGDVKVCIAGRQAIEVASAGACATDNAGHRESNNLERFSFCVSH